MTVIELHNRAMSVADNADALKRSGNKERAQELYAEAYAEEYQAAMLAIEESADEPTPSILLKSAACLAYDAALYRESEQVICYALSLNHIPTDIAEELRNLYEDVNFYRHLRIVNGVELSENEIRLSVAGRGIGYGIAREEDVTQRIQTIRQLSIRTFEWALGKPFRKSGSPSKEIQSLCSTYCAVPEAASFAIRLRFGKDISQTRIPNIQSKTTALIGELMDNVEMVNTGEIDKLSEKIKDSAYLQNFVGLAKELAPDGEDVRQVGLTGMKDGELRMVGLTRKKDEFKQMEEQALELASSASIPSVDLEEKYDISGILTIANSDLKFVYIKSGKKKTKIFVPDGLSDIVRNYFESQVSITVSKKDKTITLVSVNPIK